MPGVASHFALLVAFSGLHSLCTRWASSRGIPVVYSMLESCAAPVNLIPGCPSTSVSKITRDLFHCEKCSLHFGSGQKLHGWVPQLSATQKQQQKLQQKQQHESAPKVSSKDGSSSRRQQQQQQRQHGAATGTQARQQQQRAAPKTTANCKSGSKSGSKKFACESNRRKQ